jgi:ribulose-5-phosphate 4-epimerase/fuculose-1-phosphate aldolase
MNKALDKASSRPAQISPEEWETRVNLAACYRLVHHYGWTDMIYTHISARVPGKEDHFLINPLGYMFDEVCASNLVKIDLEGNNVDAVNKTTPINRAGFVIHSAVHAARHDVQCVMHTHTPAGMAISMLKCGLQPLSQHAQFFHGAVGYHGYEGIALDTDERQRLVKDLGDKPVMILYNHGLLATGETIGAAFSWMFHLEKACQAQLLAMGTGQELVMPPEAVSAKTRQQASGAATSLTRAEWPALLRMVERIDPSYKD